MVWFRWSFRRSEFQVPTSLKYGLALFSKWSLEPSILVCRRKYRCPHSFFLQLEFWQVQSLPIWCSHRSLAKYFLAWDLDIEFCIHADAQSQNKVKQRKIWPHLQQIVWLLLNVYKGYLPIETPWWNTLYVLFEKHNWGQSEKGGWHEKGLSVRLKDCPLSLCREQRLFECTS
jgi:hypothetical protein